MTIRDIERAFSGRAQRAAGARSHFSVLAPLVERGGELNLLFEVRSMSLARQPGDVCFPGGRTEPGEDAETCAVRETAEELGVGKGAIRVISALDELHSYGGMTVHSFLGELDHEALSAAEINIREVESVFLAPLLFFMESRPSAGDEVPLYEFGGKVIWGLTARIVSNLTRILSGGQETGSMS